MKPNPGYCIDSDPVSFYLKGVNMARIWVTLQEEERQALRAMAQRERRDVRAQAALMIRRELERQGLLPAQAHFQSAEQQRKKGQDAEQKPCRIEVHPC